jgi:hypothetical protein
VIKVSAVAVEATVAVIITDTRPASFKSCVVNPVRSLRRFRERRRRHGRVEIVVTPTVVTPVSVTVEVARQRRV